MLDGEGSGKPDLPKLSPFLGRHWTLPTLHRGDTECPVSPLLEAQQVMQVNLTHLLTAGSRTNRQAFHTQAPMAGGLQVLGPSISLRCSGSHLPFLCPLNWCCHPSALCPPFPGDCLHRQEPVQGTQAGEYSRPRQHTVPL